MATFEHTVEVEGEGQPQYTVGVGEGDDILDFTVLVVNDMQVDGRITIDEAHRLIAALDAGIVVARLNQ